MGRTLLPFRMALEEELNTWKHFRNPLSTNDRLIYDKLMQYARQHGDSGSLAARPLLSEIIFMSIALEQQQMIKKLQSELKSLQSRMKFKNLHAREDENEKHYQIV